MPSHIDDLRVTRKNDKRVKLTDQQRDEIASRKGESIHGLSREYGVSRRTVQFIQYPERAETNKKRLQERGGWVIYYTKENHRGKMQTHRDYKRELNEKGLI